jgi:hypothetical protein
LLDPLSLTLKILLQICSFTPIYLYAVILHKVEDPHP